MKVLCCQHRGRQVDIWGGTLLYFTIKLHQTFQIFKLSKGNALVKRQLNVVLLLYKKGSNVQLKIGHHPLLQFSLRIAATPATNKQTNKSSNYQMMESASLSCFLLKAMAKESKSHFHFRVSGTFPYIVSVKSSNSLIVIFPSFVSNIFSSSALHRLVCQPPV